jgi:hypothetical protein
MTKINLHKKRYTRRDVENAYEIGLNRGYDIALGRKEIKGRRK